MSYQAWLLFAAFWALFVTTPGPNAVNCIQNGMTHGFMRSLWGVAAILTQASLFLTASALGVTALILASPTLFFWVQMTGAAVLVWLGLRGWMNAAKPVAAKSSGSSLYLRALAIATFNAKSVAGYLAAFSQFVEPDVPIWDQMTVIFPTALTLTAISYTGYTGLGAGLGKLALGAILNVWLRRTLAACFVIYGVLLGTAQLPRSSL